MRPVFTSAFSDEMNQYLDDKIAAGFQERAFCGQLKAFDRFCAETGITDLREYTLYSSCEPCFMCSGAMVWLKLGRLVYGASNTDLEEILGNEGCNCSKMVFDNSFWQPEVTSGILREEALKVLKEYFGNHQKG